MLKVLTVTNNLHATHRLKNSLEEFGWDYHLIECQWKGFGTKLIEVYRYLKANPQVDEFIFCDAFDVVVLSAPEEFEQKLQGRYDMLVSAEKGLWPPILQPFKSQYYQWDHGFNYPNSGVYYAKSKYFIWLFEKYTPFYEIDDQYWMNICYLLEHDVHSDNEQEFFNSHSFIVEGEYTYENNRVQIMGNQPLFIHGNGKTDMTKIYELI